MRFIFDTVHFSPQDMLIVVGDNPDPYYKNALPEVASMPFSDSIRQSDRRVVGVIMESARIKKLSLDDSGLSKGKSLAPTTVNIFNSNFNVMKNTEPKIENDEIFRIPVAFFKVDMMDDLLYINKYIQTVRLFSDNGMEFSDELDIAKKHYNSIRKQCDIQQGITNFKVKTQIYDMVFV